MSKQPRFDLGHYLGSETKAAGLVLFWFGGAALFASALLGLQALENPTFGFDKAWMLAIPVWALVAVGLGLCSRRGVERQVVRASVWLWFVPPLLVALWLKIF